MSRQRRALVTVVLITAGTLTLFLVIALIELALHGYSYFTFRQGGIGQSSSDLPSDAEQLQHVQPGPMWGVLGGGIIITLALITLAVMLIRSGRKPKTWPAFATPGPTTKELLDMKITRVPGVLSHKGTTLKVGDTLPSTSGRTVEVVDAVPDANGNVTVRETYKAVPATVGADVVNSGYTIELSEDDMSALLGLMNAAQKAGPLMEKLIQNKEQQDAQV